MPHALAANLFGGYVHAALLALDDFLAVRILVLSAHAGAVLGRPENPLAEQTADFGLERPVVDGLGLGYLAVGPLPNHLGGSQTDFDRIKFLILHR